MVFSNKIIVLALLQSQVVSEIIVYMLQETYPTLSFLIFKQFTVLKERELVSIEEDNIKITNPPCRAILSFGNMELKVKMSNSSIEISSYFENFRYLFSISSEDIAYHCQEVIGKSITTSA